MKTDILKSLYITYKPDVNSVKTTIFGNRQVAVLLNNNQLGTCATLGNPLHANKADLLHPDFENISHRALLIAYYNACYNSSIKPNGNSDITDIIDLKPYKNVVMIGYFRTLVEKLDVLNIPVIVFDLENDDDNRLTDMQLQKKYLNNANAVIITATTLLNNTLDDIINQTKNDCDVFLLGPTSILHNHFFRFQNLKYIFGSAFSEPEKLMEIIENGGGIKDLSGFIQKIYLKRP